MRGSSRSPTTATWASRRVELMTRTCFCGSAAAALCAQPSITRPAQSRGRVPRRKASVLRRVLSFTTVGGFSPAPPRRPSELPAQADADAEVVGLLLGRRIAVEAVEPVQTPVEILQKLVPPRALQLHADAL